jgi:hypothetical protein
VIHHKKGSNKGAGNDAEAWDTMGSRSAEHMKKGRVND